MDSTSKLRPPEPTIRPNQEGHFPGSRILTPDETSSDDFDGVSSQVTDAVDAASKESTQSFHQHLTTPLSTWSPKSHCAVNSLTAHNRSHAYDQIPPADDGQDSSVQDDSNLLEEPSSEQSEVSGKASYREKYPNLLPQPESREISLEQLTTEAKSIYNGITVIESRCIHVDRVQIMAAEAGHKSDLTQDHWQALIAIHSTLLHEHHDFFLASQHPSASSALKRLAEKYSMPARVWRHGIHSFLEVLRHRLPDSIEYMLAFLYHAYQMLALLYETVPTFETTWMECLGDLGRYRMAIEDDGRDRENWTGVARYWYWKTADRSPQFGRLYHHLAILARPNALQQLYLYSRSLTSHQPFEGTRESILTLFDPILTRTRADYGSVPQVDVSFISAAWCLFTKSYNKFERFADEFLKQLDDQIIVAQSRWKEQGSYIAVTNIACVLDFGNQDSQLFRGFQQLRDATEAGSISAAQTDNEAQSPVPHDVEKPNTQPTSTDLQPVGQYDADPETHLTKAWHLCIQTLTLAFHRYDDANVFPLIHVMLVFFRNLARTDCIYVKPLLKSIPWSEVSDFLNNLSLSEGLSAQTIDPAFPRPERRDWRPLPEDYLIREHVWTIDYFLVNWFGNTTLDEVERTMELPSTVKSRAQRILWLGARIASVRRGFPFAYSAC